jgi:hypothetical protein
MIRDDNISDRNGHKSIVADKLDKEVVPEKSQKKVKRPIRAKEKLQLRSVVRQEGVSLLYNHVLTNRIRRNIK